MRQIKITLLWSWDGPGPGRQWPVGNLPERFRHVTFDFTGTGPSD